MSRAGAFRGGGGGGGGGGEPSGAASGDLGGTYPAPTVTQARGLRETTGPTTLTLGAVADGQFLKRDGSAIVGAAASGGASVLPTQAGYLTAGVANLFRVMDGVSSIASNTSAGVDTQFTSLFTPGKDMLIDLIGVPVVNNVTNAVARVGIYETDAYGRPTTLVVGSDELDTATSGRKDFAISPAVQLLGNRSYRLAYLGGVAATNARTASTTSVTSTAVTIVAGGTVGLRHATTVAQAYGALPATHPEGWTLHTSSNVMPLVFVREVQP